MAPESIIFLDKKFVDPTIKKWKRIFTHTTWNVYPPLAKNFTKGYHSVVTHVLYHFCDMSLITACAIFCSLKFHVVCTCTFFGDTICLLTNRKMIKIATLTDWLTYCIDIYLLTLLFNLQYLSKSCFGNDSKFLLPKPWVVLFFIYPTFYSLEILFTQLFSLRLHPPPRP